MSSKIVVKIHAVLKKLGMLELMLELKLEPMLSKDVKLSKRCQMSKKKQTPGLWRRFTQNKLV